MKKFFLLLIVTVLIFSGCFDSGTNHDSNPVTTTQSSSKSLEKLPLNLPANPLTLTKGLVFSVFKVIDGNQGGEILLNQTKRNIHAYAKLVVPKHAFNGVIRISISVNPNTASIIFFPSKKFAKNLILNASIQGLDLKSLNLNSPNVGFYYFPDNGPKIPIKNNGTSTNEFLGRVSVKDAVIGHFTRYGWSK